MLGSHRDGPAWLNVGLALLLALPLAARRRHPLPAVAVGFGIAAVMSRVATPPAATVSALVPVLLLAYAVGAHLRSWQDRTAGLVLLWLGVALVGLATPATLRDPAGLAPTLGCTGLTVLGGVLAAGRADRVRVRALLLAEIEEGQEARLRLAAAEQRHAIARDLHDSVAATMTVICLHAAAARRRVAADQESVRLALRTVEIAARDGIAELRASLDVLDGEVDEGAVAMDGVRSPRNLVVVLDAARAAGMTVHVDLDHAVLTGRRGSSSSGSSARRWSTRPGTHRARPSMSGSSTMSPGCRSTCTTPARHRAKPQRAPRGPATG